MRVAFLDSPTLALALLRYMMANQSASKNMSCMYYAPGMKASSHYTTVTINTMWVVWRICDVGVPVIVAMRLKAIFEITSIHFELRSTITS